MPKTVPRLLLMSLLLTTAVPVSADPQGIKFLGFHSEVPASWVPQQVSSGMRLLQLGVPGTEGGEGGEFIVYYFGPGHGGSVDANVERWKSQFSHPDGSPVEPVVTPLEGGRMPATLVELEGSYARGVVMGPQGEALPERMLLAAVVETPEGNLYPQLHGPADLVKAQRADFVAFVEGIAPDSAP